jgi:hypothetical protein
VATYDKVTNDPLNWWKTSAENYATPAVLALAELCTPTAWNYYFFFKFSL